MPLNVRRYCTFIGFLGALALAGAVYAQDATPPPQPQVTATPQAAPVVAPPTSGDVMRERISKAKAYIVVRNYSAAAYELENIRRESSDPAVQSVVNVLLMNSYLEQGDFKRAQDLLKEFYLQQKTTKPNAAANYMSVAGQIVKSARSRAERYRAMGLSPSDRTLPLEALNDLEKMRETLELVITQSKELGNDKARSSDGMALLEEASTSRAMLGRDDYDSRRWRDEVADTREQLANSRSVVMSAVTDAPALPPPPDANLVAGNTTNTAPTVEPPKPSPTREREVKVPEMVNTNPTPDAKPVYTPVAEPVADKPSNQQQEQRQQQVPENATAPPPTGGTSPLDVGSLVAYATRQQQPVYPAAAKSIRQTGIVRVDVTVDETGDVAQVQKASGPSMLQNAAKDAIKKWKFRPFVRDGQPVKAVGYVSFNFNL